MRVHTFVGLALQNIPRSHGRIAFPPPPFAPCRHDIQREMSAGALALISDKASRNLSARFAGMSRP